MIAPSLAKWTLHCERVKYRKLPRLTCAGSAIIGACVTLPSNILIVVIWISMTSGRTKAETDLNAGLMIGASATICNRSHQILTLLATSRHCKRQWYQCRYWPRTRQLKQLLTHARNLSAPDPDMIMRPSLYRATLGRRSLIRRSSVSASKNALLKKAQDQLTSLRSKASMMYAAMGAILSQLEIW
jgi:hypothetical protein